MVFSLFSPIFQDETFIDGIEEYDLQKIEALHWLLYDPSQLDEALERANLLIRKFKATGKDELALTAFEKIPTNSPESLNKVYESLSNKQSLILKEYLSWSAYFSGKYILSIAKNDKSTPLS